MIRLRRKNFSADDRLVIFRMYDEKHTHVGWLDTNHEYYLGDEWLEVPNPPQTENVTGACEIVTSECQGLSVRHKCGLNVLNMASTPQREGFSLALAEAYVIPKQWDLDCEVRSPRQWEWMQKFKQTVLLIQREVKHGSG